MKKALTAIAMLLNIACIAQTLDGDMELWRNYTVVTSPGSVLQSPLTWYSADSIIFYAKGLFPTAAFYQQVSKTQDAHSGNYAAKLVTLKQDTMGVLPALLTNCNVDVDLSAYSPVHPASGIVYSGGTPVTTRIREVNAWIKYLPNGDDTAYIKVQALSTSGSVLDTIGSGTIAIYGSHNIFELITVPISYTSSVSTPNLLRIFIKSSGNSPKENSTLYVDDINMQALGLPSFNIQKIKCYPNPVTSVLHIQNPENKRLFIKIYSITGGSVLAQEISANEMNISNLRSGSYFYNIYDEAGFLIKTGTVLLL